LDITNTQHDELADGIAPTIETFTISIVVPVYNEESCLPELVRRLSLVRQENSDEFVVAAIFVDDGSTDHSRSILMQYSREYPWIKTRFLTRNFGHQIAVTAGMDIAQGDFVAIIDSDLQDPPELIPDMIRQLIRNGDQIVYGQRTSREGESVFKLWTARFFYRFIRRLSKLDIPLDTGDFRVMNRVARDVLSQMREKNRFLRGMAPWTGLKASSFAYSRDVRYAGKPKYGIRNMINLAFNAIVSFSATPLRAIQAMGLGITILGLAGLVGFSTLALFGKGPNGIGLLASLNATTTGIMVSAIGVLGGYVHRIQDEVRERPMYLTTEEEL
jgi:glycosyltransferase involved in cell wall biosynthesis